MYCINMAQIIVAHEFDIEKISRNFCQVLFKHKPSSNTGFENESDFFDVEIVAFQRAKFKQNF